MENVADRPNRTPIIVGFSIFALVLLLALVAASGTEGERFLGVGVQFVPFVVLAALAYGGVKNRAAAMFAYLWLALMVLGVMLLSFIYIVLGFVRDFDLLMRVARDRSLLSTVDINDLIKPGLGPALLWAFLLMFVVAVASGLMLSRRVRQAVAGVLPIDPDNFVHKIALCMLTALTLGSFVPLIVLGGKPPLLEVLSTQGVEGLGIGVRPQDLLYQLVWTIPATLVAGGWPIARKLGETMKRLAMVRPTTMQVWVGTGLGVVLALAVTFGLDPAITWLWRALGWPTTNVEVFGDLTNNIVNPLGAVLVGVTAGIGEEMAVRGLLQPRIGLVASNLAFTSLHAYQYGPDALLSVFIVGLVLGIIRARSNTSTSAIVHGVYDFTVIMTAVMLT